MPAFSQVLSGLWDVNDGDTVVNARQFYNIFKEVVPCFTGYRYVNQVLFFTVIWKVMQRLPLCKWKFVYLRRMMMQINKAYIHWQLYQVRLLNLIQSNYMNSTNNKQHCIWKMTFSAGINFLCIYPVL